MTDCGKETQGGVASGNGQTEAYQEDETNVKDMAFDTVLDGGTDREKALQQGIRERLF